MSVLPWDNKPVGGPSDSKGYPVSYPPSGGYPPGGGWGGWGGGYGGYGGQPEIYRGQKSSPPQLPWMTGGWGTYPMPPGGGRNADGNPIKPGQSPGGGWGDWGNQRWDRQPRGGHFDNRAPPRGGYQGMPPWMTGGWGGGPGGGYGGGNPYGKISASSGRPPINVDWMAEQSAPGDIR